MKDIEQAIRQYIENYNEYLEDTIEYPDEADDDFIIFCASEKEILDYFEIPQTEKLNQTLYYFIQDSCYENRIKYSDKIATQIIKTMEKIKRVNQFEKEFGKFFENKLKELKNSPLYDLKELTNVPGIYVFYKGEEAIYVGRTDKIKERIQYHTRPGSQRGSATFAFNLAKVDYEKTHKKITTIMAELEKDENFKPLFLERKKYLSGCKFRILKEENDVLQTMLEPYIAYKLGTYPINNTFENH